MFCGFVNPFLHRFLFLHPQPSTIAIVLLEVSHITWVACCGSSSGLSEARSTGSANMCQALTFQRQDTTRAFNIPRRVENWDIFRGSFPRTFWKNACDDPNFCYFQFRDAFFEWVSQDVCKIIKSVWCILCVCVCHFPLELWTGGKLQSLNINDQGFSWSAVMTDCQTRFMAITSEWDHEMHSKNQRKTWSSQLLSYDGQTNQSGRGSWETKPTAIRTHLVFENSVVFHDLPLVCQIPGWKTAVFLDNAKGTSRRTSEKVPEAHVLHTKSRLSQDRSLAKMPWTFQWHGFPMKARKSKGSPIQTQNWPCTGPWKGLEGPSYLLKVVSSDFLS